MARHRSNGLCLFCPIGNYAREAAQTLGMRKSCSGDGGAHGALFCPYEIAQGKRRKRWECVKAVRVMEARTARFFVHKKLRKGSGAKVGNTQKLFG